MRHIGVAILMGGLAVAAIPDSVCGQGAARLTRPHVRPSQRPAISPYLNLLGTSPGSGTFAFQYFQRVRPELEFRRANSQFQRSLQGLEQRLEQPALQQAPQSGLGPTGHPAAFFNYGGYYQFGNVGGRAAGFGTQARGLRGR